MINESKQRKIGAILSYLNLGLGCIIPLLYTPIMLNLMGQAEYGLYALSNSVVGYLALLNLGMGSAVVRYASIYRAENRILELRGLVGLFLLIYSGLAVVVMTVGTVLAFNVQTFFSNGLNAAELSRMRILLLIMSASTAISLPSSVFMSIIGAYERFVFSKSISVAFTILTPVLNLVALFAGAASIGIAAVGLALQILSAIIWGAYSCGKLSIWPSFRKMPTSLLKEIVVFSAFIFLSQLIDMLYWATDKVLLGALLGAAAVAIYNIGCTFTSMLQHLAQAISGMFTPMIMGMSVKDKTASASMTSELLTRIGRLQYYVVSFVLSGYIVFGQVFLPLWAGTGYEDAYWVALLNMVPLSIPLIQSIAYSYIVAQNKHRFRAIIYGVIAVVNIISTYLIIPHAGILGAAACTCVSFIVGNGIIMNLYYSRVMKLDIKNFWINIVRISFVPVLMTIAGYILVNSVFSIANIWMFLLGVGVYSIIFFVLTWFFSFNAYEKGLFLGIIKKRAA